MFVFVLEYAKIMGNQLHTLEEFKKAMFDIYEQGRRGLLGKHLAHPEFQALPDFIISEIKGKQILTHRFYPVFEAEITFNDEVSIFENIKFLYPDEEVIQEEFEEVLEQAEKFVAESNLSL